MGDGLAPEAMASWPPAARLAGAGQDGRRLYRLGSEDARERIWIQCDAAHDPRAAALAGWAVLESLAGGRVNSYRQLVLARSQVAVATPPAGAPLRASSGEPPIFDAGALGATPGVLASMERFAPTLVLHLQDWGQERGALAAASTPAGFPAGGAGLRLVESFYLAPDLHAALGEPAPFRTILGRPTAVARSLAAHPDARVGLRARRYVTRMGFRVYDETAAAGDGGTGPSRAAAVRLAPGRYAPRLEWRRLGAASLGEIALARYGALAMCGQTFDSPAEERAGALLALAEATIIYRLGIDVPETRA